MLFFSEDSIIIKRRSVTLMLEMSRFFQSVCTRYEMNDKIDDF